MIVTALYYNDRLFLHKLNDIFTEIYEKYNIACMFFSWFQSTGGWMSSFKYIKTNTKVINRSAGIKWALSQENVSSGFPTK